MINEIYISMAFATCINTSRMSMATPSYGFNMVYTIVMGAILLCWPIYVTVKFARALKNMPSLQVEMKEGGEIE